MPVGGTGIDGRGEEIVLEGVGERALLVAQHAGDQADDRVGDHGSGQFSSGEDVVADADLAGDQVVPDPLVDALVVPTEDDDILLEGEAIGSRLIEQVAVGGGEDHLVVGALRPQRLDGALHRLYLHHHAGGTAEGVVIHAAPLIGGVVAQIMDNDLSETLLLSSLKHRHADEGLDHLRQYGQYIDSHAAKIPSPRHIDPLLPLLTSTVPHRTD